MKKNNNCRKIVLHICTMVHVRAYTHTHAIFKITCICVSRNRYMIRVSTSQRYWNSPEAGVPGGCEPPGMCAGNRTQILRGTRGHLCSWLMGHLSSLNKIHVCFQIYISYIHKITIAPFTIDNCSIDDCSKEDT